MTSPLYCKACLLKNQELTSVYYAGVGKNGDIFSCPACKVDGVEVVSSEVLLMILWAAAGHTPKQRATLQEYIQQMLKEGGS